jgi:hypothetical protein
MSSKSILPKICQIFGWAEVAIIQGVPTRRNPYEHPAGAWSSEITRAEGQILTEALRAEDRGEPSWPDLMGQGASISGMTKGIESFVVAACLTEGAQMMPILV